MPQFEGPTYINPEPIAERPLGLFDVALGPLPMPRPETQGGGIIYVPDSCADDVYLIAMDCPPITGTKTFTALESPVSGAPFAVMTSYTCGSIGFSFDEVEQRLRTRMMLREQRAVERRLWQGSTGDLGTIGGLFATATTVGPASCPVEAVEILEQTLADNGVVGGIIHARPAMAPHLNNNHLVYENGRIRRTCLNTRIAFGQGYAGTGPTGQAVSGDTEWMYATGRVVIYGSEVAIPPIEQTLDRSLNQIYALAERVFVVSVECGIWAIQVTRNCTTSGST